MKQYIKTLLLGAVTMVLTGNLMLVSASTAQAQEGEVCAAVYPCDQDGNQIVKSTGYCQAAYEAICAKAKLKIADDKLNYLSENVSTCQIAKSTDADKYTKEIRKLKRALKKAQGNK